jgi:hypothetical protein
MTQKVPNFFSKKIDCCRNRPPLAQAHFFEIIPSKWNTWTAIERVMDKTCDGHAQGGW